MQVDAFTGGPLGTNAYLVTDEGAGRAVLVDAPRGVAKGVLEALAERRAALVAIVNTHGHWDHIGDNEEIRRRTGSPLLIHGADTSLLERPAMPGMTLPFAILPHRPDRLIGEGDRVEAGAVSLDVLHTPGHTPGGICLYAGTEGVLLAGDTLFDGAYGRTDLPGASERQMWESLLRLATLPGRTRFYPGHGPPSTIGEQGWLTALVGRPGERGG